MTKPGTLLAFLLVIAMISDLSCTPRAKYDRKLSAELASGVRYDSIFMGFYFGMPEKEFYLRCWNLNKKGIIKQGASNTTVEYFLKKELKHPGQMDFYPRFNEGKIFEMPVRFMYSGWAPWNKKLSSEKLQQDILRWYEKTYGKGFMRIDHPERGRAYVKINGNRRLTIFREDELHVWAVFTDLLVSRNWNSLRKDSIQIKQNQ